MDPINTPRLTLRQWKIEDVQPFAKMCADPLVMRFFPSTLSLEESESSIERFSNHIRDQGFGFWAVENTQSNDLIGFIGLQVVGDGFDFSPSVEIGWRLARGYWGQGFATEGARASLKFGFEIIRFDEIVSMTASVNTPSERVMQRIGMIGSPKKFAHPKLPLNHPLSEHVLYRLTQMEWQQLLKKGEVN